jgi:hypothetical protein
MGSNFIFFSNRFFTFLKENRWSIYTALTGSLNPFNSQTCAEFGYYQTLKIGLIIAPIYPLFKLYIKKDESKERARPEAYY